MSLTATKKRDFYFLFAVGNSDYSSGKKILQTLRYEI